MVDSENFSKEKVEYPDRKDSLPESDKVEAEWYAPEDLVLLYGSDNAPACIFRF